MTTLAPPLIQWVFAASVVSIGVGFAVLLVMPQHWRDDFESLYSRGRDRPARRSTDKKG